MRPRLFAFALALGLVLALLPFTAATVAAANPVLTDSIAPGVIPTGTDGFGSSTVQVKENGYVTYLVRTSPNLAGRSLDIYVNSGGDWAKATNRIIGADGTARYHARVAGRTGFWAKLPAQGSTPEFASHGRSAAVSKDGRTIITMSCDDFAPTGSSTRVVINRRAQAALSTTVMVVICSNASTGFSWTTVAVDPAHIKQVGHTIHGSSSQPPGAPGTERWSYRLTTTGTGRVTLTYSQPWTGGEKAAWTLMLTVQS